jgi:hypothetical protein
MTKKNQYNLLLLKLLLFMIFTNKRNHCFNITGYLNQSELIYDLNLNQSEPIINDLKFNQNESIYEDESNLNKTLFNEKISYYNNDSTIVNTSTESTTTTTNFKLFNTTFIIITPNLNESNLSNEFYYFNIEYLDDKKTYDLLTNMLNNHGLYFLALSILIILLLVSVLTLFGFNYQLSKRTSTNLTMLRNKKNISFDIIDSGYRLNRNSAKIINRTDSVVLNIINENNLNQTYEKIESNESNENIYELPCIESDGYYHYQKNKTNILPVTTTTTTTTTSNKTSGEYEYGMIANNNKTSLLTSFNSSTNKKSSIVANSNVFYTSYINKKVNLRSNNEFEFSTNEEETADDDDDDDESDYSIQPKIS